ELRVGHRSRSVDKGVDVAANGAVDLQCAYIALKITCGLAVEHRLVAGHEGIAANRATRFGFVAITGKEEAPPDASGWPHGQGRAAAVDGAIHLAVELQRLAGHHQAAVDLAIDDHPG